MYIEFDSRLKYILSLQWWGHDISILAVIMQFYIKKTNKIKQSGKNKCLTYPAGRGSLLVDWFCWAWVGFPAGPVVPSDSSDWLAPPEPLVEGTDPFCWATGVVPEESKYFNIWYTF